VEERLMQAHQQRVVDEKADLDEKVGKLEIFLEGDFFKTLDYGERMRLGLQLNYMRGYSHVLGWRIREFA
jgi:hypothetical protein